MVYHSALSCYSLYRFTQNIILKPSAMIRIKKISQLLIILIGLLYPNSVSACIANTSTAIHTYQQKTPESRPTWQQIQHFSSPNSYEKIWEFWEKCTPLQRFLLAILLRLIVSVFVLWAFAISGLLFFSLTFEFSIIFAILTGISGFTTFLYYKTLIDLIRSLGDTKPKKS